MPSNVSSLLEILFMALQGVLFAVVLFSCIYSVVGARKNGDFSRLKMLCAISVGMVVVALSWTCNFGWVRFILTMLLVPFSHAILMVIMNMWVFEYIKKSKALKISNSVFNITYLLSYLLLPDGGELGSKYVFFGLIKNSVVSNMFQCLCIGAVLVHLCVIFLQIIMVFKLKKEA